MSDNNEEHKYIVQSRSSFVDGEEIPPLWKYIGSRLFIPIILTFVLALFKDSFLFIVLMWVVVIWSNVSNYYKIYPPSRPATEEEVLAYKTYRIYEAAKLKRQYEWILKHVDIYGRPKKEDEELSEISKKYTKNGFENAELKLAKMREAKEREEMLRKIKEVEDEFGLTWDEIV